MTPFPKPSWMALIVVGFLLVAFSYAITWITVSGTLWSLLPEKFKNYPRHAVQAFILSAKSSEPAPIFLGDTLFLNQISKLANGHFVPINAIDPNDMEDAVKAIQRRYRRPSKKMANCPLVLQLSPYFTMRMNVRGEKLNYDYFNIQSRKLNWYVPNKATELFWDTLRDLTRVAVRPEEKSQEADRLTTFPIQLSKPDPNLENWQLVQRRIEKMKIPVWLVPDAGGSDYDSAPAVLSYFENDFMEELTAGRFALPHVRVMPFETLPAALETQCDYRER